MQYAGIIGIEGLEGWTPINPTEDAMNIFETGCDSELAKLLSTMMLRCRFNEQRHPVIIICELNDHDAELLEGLDPVIAATLVLRNSDKIAVCKRQVQNWKLLQRCCPQYQGETTGAEVDVYNF